MARRGAPALQGTASRGACHRAVRVRGGLGVRSARGAATRQLLPVGVFAITHFSALHLKREQRLASPFFSWFGLAGCFVLLFFIPPLHLVIGTVTLALATSVRFIARWQFRAYRR